MPAPEFGPDQTGQEGTLTGNNLGIQDATNPNDPFFLDMAKRSSGNVYFQDGSWHKKVSGGGSVSFAGGSKSQAAQQPDAWRDFFTGHRDIFGGLTEQGYARLAREEGNKNQDGIAARMQAFIDSMLGPMDPNDPVYKGLLQAGTDAAQRHAGAAGLGARSGLGATNAASVAQQNVLPWMQARQQAGATMLAQLSNRDISLGNLAQGQQQIDAGLAESKANANKNFMGTLGSIGGGVIGGIYGGPGGAAVGSQLGGAALGALGGGGAAGPSYPRQAWRPGGNYGTGY